MWTAKIVEKNKTNGQVNIVVAYSDGVESFTETYPNISDSNALKIKIANKIKSIQETYKLAEDIPFGDIDPTVNTPEITARRTWQNLYEKLIAVNTLVSLGVLTGNEAFVGALKDEVKTTFLPRYLDLK